MRSFTFIFCLIRSFSLSPRFLVNFRMCEDGRINKKVFSSKRFIELHPRLCLPLSTQTHIQYYLENTTQIDWLERRRKRKSQRTDDRKRTFARCQQITSLRTAWINGRMEHLFWHTNKHSASCCVAAIELYVNLATDCDRESRSIKNDDYGCYCCYSKFYFV